MALNWKPQIYSPSSTPEDKQLQFKTDAGLEYTVLIVPAQTYFPDYPRWNKTVLSVIFECSGKPVYDAQIMPTICLILHLWMTNKQWVLLWVCSADNDKHHARFRLFQMYWNKYEQFVKTTNIVNWPKWEVTKYDNIISADSESYYSSIVVHNDNPNNREIVEAFAKGTNGLCK